jgi:NAD(P)H dehydrogenase (quinone)
MKICAIDGHPDHGRLSSALLDRYLDAAARASGATAERFAVRDMKFDPVLHHGYQKRQDWEPDLERFAESLKACDHLALAFPMWWGGMPASLKGLFDRVFLPGVAFKYHQDDPFWDRLLAGRSADVLITSDTPRWFLRFRYGDPLIKQLKGQILGFSGFKPVRTRVFSPIRKRSDRAIEKILRSSARLGASIPSR